MDGMCIFSSLLALFIHIIASQISHLIPSIFFFIHKIILQKADEGRGASNSEGGDYDVSWMVGVEGLANEVRIYVAFVVTFINKISDIFSDFT